MGRWVMVDDTDLDIVYSPSANWFPDAGALDEVGYNGPPYLSTVHGTNSEGNFSYSFEGTAFTLTGSIQVARTPIDSTSWTCIIDETPTTTDDPFEVDNRSRFCEKNGLLDGPHTLQVNAHGSKSQTFWFDHLQYIPSASVSLANSAVYIDTTDPMWNFGPGWIRDSIGYITNQTGAQVEFEFNGISLQWYGYYNATYPFAATNATYSIDGTTPISFTLNGVLARSQNMLENYQLFFTTDTYSAGPHKIEIIYNGDSSSTPLSVQSVVIQNGTTILPTSESGTSSTSSAARVTSTNSSSTLPAATESSLGENTSGSNSKSSAAEIAGGIVGGVVVGGVVIFIFLAFIFFRKRRNTMQSGRVVQTGMYYDLPPEY